MQINNESTKEKVADFLSLEYKISEVAKANIIKEGIDGEVLFDLKQQDLVFTLKIKSGEAKKILEFISSNKGKISQKIINEKITSKSDSEEVKAFFKKCIGFDGELNNLDGKQLLVLTEEKFKKLKIGLNLGQRKKLFKYIGYFKTLKKEEKIQEPFISENSSPEEIIIFLREKAKFSEESINELKELDMDGNLFFSLDNEYIDGFTIKDEEKNILKEIIIKKTEKQAYSNNNINDKEKHEIFNQSDSFVESNNNSDIKHYSSIEEFLTDSNNRSEDLYAPYESNNLNYYLIQSQDTEEIITNANYYYFFNIYFEYCYYKSLEIATY